MNYVYIDDIDMSLTMLLKFNAILIVMLVLWKKCLYKSNGRDIVEFVVDMMIDDISDIL